MKQSILEVKTILVHGLRPLFKKEIFNIKYEEGGESVTEYVNWIFEA